MPPHIDSSTTGAAPAPQVAAATGPRFNAVKHGFYSPGVLLPGDDAEAFRRERLALFRLFRPQTVREVRLVDQMAQWQWQLDRSGPMQARCDEQALEPATDAGGRIGEPLAHRRLHTTMDVTLHRLRLDRAVHRNEQDLLALQKLRRMGLIEGAVKLPPDCYLEHSGEIVPLAVPAAAPVVDPPAACQVAPGVPASPAAGEARDSEDGGNGFCLEQKETGEGAPRKAGQIGFEPGMAVLPGGDARPTGAVWSAAELPAWLNGRPLGHSLAATGAVSLPPTIPGSGPGRVEYSAVSSL